ncbi:heterokaryon incompatibility protein-domain-containing protein [Xylaria acuta]|nr:heterokaryon incompatibility protein-domain-containing protein [Xylaria acuta]
MQKHPYSSGRLPYSWGAVGDYWPRRLFHINTKTSIERNGSQSYTDPNGNVHMRPQYSILSYTWGRFEIKQGPSLEVRGTSWKIPAIDPDHFTVSSFEKVVDRLAEDGIQWAWIDIACIDQENEEVKADEIGRQAAIFQHAERAFVWLSSLDARVSTETVSNIIEDSLEIRRHLDRWNAESALAVKNLVTRLDSALKIFFGDMWFSSLWTLQEIVMRKDALALSRDGDSVPWDDKFPMFFTMFINHCQNIYQDLQALGNQRHQPKWIDSFTAQSLDDPDEDTIACIDNIKKLILSAGFYYLFSENPNVQYGTAQFRKTRDAPDRIYGIMQIYNVKVGKPARPHESPNLETLEIEFGAAINAHCPILGQSYVHTVKDLPHNTWCITQMSTVPDQLMSYQEPHKQCSISANPMGIATAHGKCCPFPDLVRVHVDLRFQLEDQTLELFLDHCISSKLTCCPNRLRPAIQEDEIRCFPGLYERYGRQNLWVLLLGDVRGSFNYEQRAYDRTHIGLLIGRDKWYAEEEWIGSPFHRYGVCTWLEPTERVKREMERLQWRDVELSLI